MQKREKLALVVGVTAIVLLVVLKISSGLPWGQFLASPADLDSSGSTMFSFDNANNVTNLNNVQVIGGALTLLPSSPGGGGVDPSSPGLALYYDFSASGSQVPDRSGNGRNGSISGADCSVAGHSGTGCYFNGSNARVTAVTKVIPDGSSTYTAAFWLKPGRGTGSGSSADVPLEVGITSGDNYPIGFSVEDSHPRCWSQTTGGDQSVSAPTALAVGQWYHLASVWQNNTLSCYLNGQLVGTASLSGSLTPSSLVSVGTNTASGQDAMATVDDLAIWTRALSSSEISALASGGSGGTILSGSAQLGPISVATPPTSLTASWSTVGANPTIRIQFSGDNGSTWRDLQNGVAYTAGGLPTSSFIAKVSITAPGSAPPALPFGLDSITFSWSRSNSGDPGGVQQTCGNNIREGTEVCDGSALGGQTCSSQGLGSGSLLCNSTCSAFITTQCQVDKTAPIISNSQATPTSNSAVIAWTTNEPADSRVEYGATAGYGKRSGRDSNLVTQHSVVLSGLDQQKLYHYRLLSRDASNNLATSGDYTFTTVATPPTNQPPVVSAGADQSVTLPTSVVTLAGTATDDGLPNPPHLLTTTWTKQSGPGTVTFANASQLSTLALFSTAGSYVLRLTASDSLASVYDEMMVTVQPAGGTAWVSPIGIPAPIFGAYNYATVDRSIYAGQSGYQNDAVDGLYTHYVNSTASNCTSVGNGTKAVPRCSIPTSVPAGSVVLVRGGPYNSSNPIRIGGTGDVTHPVFIIGLNSTAGARPKFTRPIELSGSYTLVDNIDLDNWTTSNDSGFNFIGSYLALRNSEVHNGPNATTVGVDIGVQTNHHIVLYNNKVHDNGDWQATYDQDDHGIGGVNGSYVWVLDNEMYHNSGDGIQINNAAAHHIFVGRNVAYQNKQSGFWSKDASDVIFSQNIAHDHTPSGSSPGQGLGLQYDPKRVWFLFNTSYNNVFGIETGGGNNGGRQDVYFIGNRLYNNSQSGIRLDSDDGTHYVIGNTIYNNPIGIENGYTNTAMYLTDNLISVPTSNPQSRHIKVPSDQSGTVAQSSSLYNFFAGPAKIEWGPDGVKTLAQFKAAFPGQCAGCMEGDPKFVDLAGNDVHLQVTSPAINTGVAVPAAAKSLFQTSFGIPFPDVDFDAAPRPQGAGWDIGAFEYH